MPYAREVTETDFITVCVDISSLSQSAYFLSLFEPVNFLSKQFYLFQACILLLHVFFLTSYCNAGAGAGYTFYPLSNPIIDYFSHPLHFLKE